jgi:hypothetical protein
MKINNNKKKLSGKNKTNFGRDEREQFTRKAKQKPADWEENKQK